MAVVACKLDVEKAYNHVNQDFFLQMMGQKVKIELGGSSVSPWLGSQYWSWNSNKLISALERVWVSDHIIVVKNGKKLSTLDIVRDAHLKMVTNMNSRT